MTGHMLFIFGNKGDADCVLTIFVLLVVYVLFIIFMVLTY